MPVDSPIEFRFDRYLLPNTATRQSIRVYSGTPDQAVLLQPTYDVVERVVTYRTAYGSALTPGLLYQVEAALPDASDQGFGFRAFDGAPLVDPRPQPGGDGHFLRFSFRTARAAGTPPPAGREAGDGADAGEAGGSGCDAALTALSGCATCHSGETAPMGLVLDSVESVLRTASARVARETEGPVAGATIANPARFGVGMPLIDPGSASSSYLLYKLLVKPGNFGQGAAACSTTHRVSLPDGQCLPAPAAERARLEDWFVRLDPMPPGEAVLGGGVTDLRALANFIRRGATADGCP